MENMVADEIRERGLESCFEVGYDFAGGHRHEVIGFHIVPPYKVLMGWD
jgi:hypothetical protein